MSDERISFEVSRTLTVAAGGDAVTRSASIRLEMPFAAAAADLAPILDELSDRAAKYIRDDAAAGRPAPPEPLKGA